MAPPPDLREWIALLEREGEASFAWPTEVDPYLEVTEIVDRTVPAPGGRRFSSNTRRATDHQLLINQFGTERRMCLALGVGSLDDAAAKLGSVLEMQPPQGLAEKVRGLKTLKSIADSRTEDGSPRGSPRRRARRRRRGSRPPADPALLARRPGAVHHAPRGGHARPQDGHAERRHVPHAGVRLAARPGCTGSATRGAPRTTAQPTAGPRWRSPSAATRRPLLAAAPLPRQSTSSCSPAS